MTNDTSGINKKITVNGENLETVTSFMFLGSVITDEGSKLEILFRTAQTAAVMTRLKPECNDKGISLISKIRLMRSLLTFIFLYACESWTLAAELPKKNTGDGNGVLPQKYYASHTKTMLPTKKSVPRSSRQSDHTKTCPS